MTNEHNRPLRKGGRNNRRKSLSSDWELKNVSLCGCFIDKESAASKSSDIRRSQPGAPKSNSSWPPMANPTDWKGPACIQCLVPTSSPNFWAQFIDNFCSTDDYPEMQCWPALILLPSTWQSHHLLVPMPAWVILFCPRAELLSCPQVVGCPLMSTSFLTVVWTEAEATSHPGSGHQIVEGIRQPPACNWSSCKLPGQHKEEKQK